MSSMRNAVQRRNHRERAQPTERSKWGLLEKRKDYKLRAADHKTKQKKISALKQKASERNEDEFYFGMMRGADAKKQRADGSGAGKSLGEEVVRLMKTQDVGYLRTMLQKVRKERERLGRDVVVGEVGVQVLPEAVGGSKVVFGEDGEVVGGLSAMGESEEIDDMDLDDMADLEDLDGLDGDLSGEGDESEDDEDLTPEQREAKRRRRHALEVKQRKLEALKEQEEKLATALDQLEEQRAKMNGSIGGVNKNGVKFKPRQRKR